MSPRSPKWSLEELKRPKVCDLLCYSTSSSAMNSPHDSGQFNTMTVKTTEKKANLLAAKYIGCLHRSWAVKDHPWIVADGRHKKDMLLWRWYHAISRRVLQMQSACTTPQPAVCLC